MDDFDEDFYLACNPDVALAVTLGALPSAREHFLRFGQSEGRLAAAPGGVSVVPGTKAHRRITARWLRGRGLEVGAFESPCFVPRACTVTYCDRLTPTAARLLFPELATAALAPVDVVVDLDRDGLGAIATDSQDFVIFNHVIEHAANPIRCLDELLRVTRAGGHLVIAAPDRRFTFDAQRAETCWEHLEAEYRAGVTAVSDAHWFDLLALSGTGAAATGICEIEAQLASYRARREHAHVWSSAGFRVFLEKALALLGRSCSMLVEFDGDQTQSEYFAILEKG